jgi:hypothetical protein
MDDDQQDDGRERGDEPLNAAPLDWSWWPSYHDSVLARQKAEMAQLKALSWALERIFDDPK